MAIVKMRRLYLLAMREEQDALLRTLLHLGCVEVRPMARGSDGALWEPFSPCRADTRALEDTCRTLEEARALVKNYAAAKKHPLRRRAVEEQTLLQRSTMDAALRAAEEILAQGKRIEKLENAREELRRRCAQLQPWCACPVPLGQTETAATCLSFGLLPRKTDTGALALQLEAQAAELFPLARRREGCYAAALCHRGTSEQTEHILRAAGFRAETFSAGCGTAREEIARAEKKQAALKQEAEHARAAIAARSREVPLLELAADQARQYLALERAGEKGLGNGTVVILTGWVRADRESALRRALEDYACALQTEQPRPEDTPPTLLRNPKWMEPINVVTEMYALPDYRGIDPNPLIFWFYLFFFGFMFADVAYGLILVAASLLWIRLFDPRGTLGRLAHLGVYLGISTAVCGFFTGGFFGNAIEVVAQTFFGVPLSALPLWVQRFSAGLVFSPLTSPMAVLFAALAVGAVQLLFGQCVHIAMARRDGRLWDGLLDTVPWWVLFAGIYRAVASGSAVLLWLGIAALVLTQGRKRNGLGAKLLGGVASLYGVTNWLSDILSYSRLMALMLATSVIATVVNTLGALPGSLIAFVPVFLIGHLFNIGVNLIGTYVHAARLQYLEFYGKFYREGGVPFRPLRYETRYIDVIEEDETAWEA